MKIITHINHITNINENTFISNIQGDNLLYYKYHQTNPFYLMIMVNFSNNELVIEFTGKILLDNYIDLIHEGNIRQCLDIVNSLEICEIDVDAVMAHAHVAKCDVTKDIQVDSFPMVICQLRQQLRNYRQWNCRNYKSGVVIENTVKTPRHKKRLTVYDKSEELRKAENASFLNALADQEALLNYFENKIRFELNINTMAQIRKLLHIHDNSLIAVLSSDANPILTVVDEAMREFTPSRSCISLRDYERELFLKECHNDLVEVEAKIRTLVSKNTAIKRVMQPYIELHQQMQNNTDIGLNIRRIVA